MCVCIYISVFYFFCFLHCEPLPMETLQCLSNESFSYSWLKNIKPTTPFDTFSVDDGFDFNVPSSSDLAHADQLFSNGLLLPLHDHPLTHSSDSTTFNRSLSLDSSRTHFDSIEPMSMDSSFKRRSAAIRPLPMEEPSHLLGSRNNNNNNNNTSRVMKLPFFGTCRSSSSSNSSSTCVGSFGPKRRILSKYLCFFAPLYKKVRGFRPRKSTGPAIRSSSQGDVDTVIDSSIYDAVLYCKKSSGRG
ncbi:hypothetical protein QJS10_CPA01g02237 [Acorus calamus]|uniref:Membrane-associated kinase regulator 6 n=1 Tax=Acorus calamus TaxID=4465 RepID=A0AAV9FL29_ACOCL|nr:hypothetical protein QJS10_CPA01g02237 [Acorus calamus]